MPQNGRRQVKVSDLSPPLRRTYKMIENRAEEHKHDPAIPLMTRRSIALNYPRIRIRSKGTRRKKRTGLSYPVASRFAKRLVDLGFVIEEPVPPGEERKGRPLRPAKPPKPKVIVARPRKDKRKSQ